MSSKIFNSIPTAKIGEHTVTTFALGKHHPPAPPIEGQVFSSSVEEDAHDLPNHEISNLSVHIQKSEELEAEELAQNVVRNLECLDLLSANKESYRTLDLRPKSAIGMDKKPFPLWTEDEAGFQKELLFFTTDASNHDFTQQQIAPELERSKDYALPFTPATGLKENATVADQKITSSLKLYAPSSFIVERTSKLSSRIAPQYAPITRMPLVRKTRENPVYRQTVRDQLLSLWNGEYGYQDQHGYIVDYFIDGTSTTLGEGTLHTAIAIIALATGNYNADSWERDNANSKMSVLFDTLFDKSWGNRDNLGRIHPIRHPDVYDYNINGQQFRNSPLTKDSFGAIVAACYYAYDCPQSSQVVREKAKQLIQKWIEYLVLNQWRTHSNYIEGEFEADGDYYANIFSGPDREKDRIDYRGPEAFILLPHEIYALKNAGAHLGLVTAQIEPWTTDLPVALKQTIVDIAAPYLGNVAASTLNSILSLLAIRIPYSVDFGGLADWPFGIMKDEFVIDLLSADQQRNITDAFRNSVVDAIKEYFRLLFLGQDQPIELVGLAVNRILDQMPDKLGRDSWRSILMRAINQLLPWFSDSGWIEVASFIGSLQLIRSMNKPDVTSYSLWSFAAECETRPEIYTLMKPFLLDFWEFIRRNNNPNGLWAWLVEDGGRVNQQLELFESNDEDRWSKFAYGSKAFTEWAEEPQSSERKSPRLDYLLLDGLAEMGAPTSLPDIIGDWWNSFEEAAREEAGNLVVLIKSQFNSSGKYLRKLIDAAGHSWVELWEAGGKYTREISIDSQRIERLFSILGGEVERYRWNLAGTFTDYFKWQRIFPDGSVSVEDLVEWRARDVQGQLERIMWDSTHSFKSYSKWWRSTLGGGAEPADVAISKVRELSGILTRQTWSVAGAFESLGKWCRSAADGSAADVDMIEKQVRDAAGVLSRIIWDNNHVFQSYAKWWRSTLAGGAAAADVAISKVREASGFLTIQTWSAAGAFESLGKWCRSATDGTVTVTDMIEDKVRDAVGVLSRTIWDNNHVFQLYEKWYRSNQEGGAVFTDMIEKKVRDAAGILSRTIWDNNHVFQSYAKWWRSTASGGAAAADVAISKVREASGFLTIQTWSAAGAFESLGRWCRSAADGAAAATDIIESQARDAAGVLSRTIWDNNHVFQSYAKWWRSTLAGGAVGADIAISQVREASGILTLQTWSAAGAFESLGKWCRSAVDGSAAGVDMIEDKVRDAAGILSRTTWDNNHVFQSYAKWWRSTASGGAVGADIAISKVREASGILKKWTYTISGAFESFGHWYRSAIDGSALDTDMAENKLRSAAGELQKWIWGDDGVFRNYWLWSQSNADGSAAAENIRKIFTQEANGNRIVETWDAAGHYAQSIFDSAGRLIGGVNIPMPQWPPQWW